MTKLPRTTSTKRSKRVLPLGFRLILIVLAAVPLFAHGGFTHVRGTVVRVATNILTVKTATGNIDVKLDDKTEFTENGHQARAADLKPGVRVVIDLPEGGKNKIAHSVKIGSSSPPPKNSPKVSHP